MCSWNAPSGVVQIINTREGKFSSVVIGNPPYVEYAKVTDYKIKNYTTENCGNLYAFVMERCKHLIASKTSYISMIVPLSGHSTERMSPLVKYFYNTFIWRIILNLSADAHPQKLFDGVKFRLAIFMCSNSCAGCFSTKYRRWFSDERGNLFATVELIDNTNYSYSNIIGKVSSYTIKPIFDKMRKESVFFFSQKGKYNCLYHNAPVNWIRAHSFVPYFRSERDGEGITTQLKVISFDDEKFVYIASAIINSSLFFVWWITNSDCYHLNKPEIQTFKFTLGKDRDILCRLSRKLAADLLKKSKRRVYVYKTTGRVEYDEFYMKRSKDIIDEIDECLGKHYGLSEIELDFIINYDIKYRLGEQADC